jgi:hypothetical protein
MKDLGMQWREIKNTPRHELIGLLSAHAEYSEFHSMDGYSDKDISEMAKDRPEIRPQYARYLEKRRKFEDMLGEKKKRPTFRGLI